MCTTELLGQLLDGLMPLYMAGQVDRRLCPQGRWLGDLLLARTVAYRYTVTVQVVQKSCLAAARASKTGWHRMTNFLHGYVWVCMQCGLWEMPLCIIRCSCMLNASLNANFETCLGQHRGKERQNDWHEGVYSKQEQGLAGRQAITQECTLLSSSFFFVSLAGSIHPQKQQHNSMLSLWRSCELSTRCLHLTRLTTTVCGIILNIQRVFKWRSGFVKSWKKELKQLIWQHFVWARVTWLHLSLN